MKYKRNPNLYLFEDNGLFAMNTTGDIFSIDNQKAGNIIKEMIKYLNVEKEEEIISYIINDNSNSISLLEAKGCF